VRSQSIKVISERLTAAFNSQIGTHRDNNESVKKEAKRGRIDAELNDYGQE
jgi:hypothetical protein